MVYIQVFGKLQSFWQNGRNPGKTAEGEKKRKERTATARMCTNIPEFYQVLVL